MSRKINQFVPETDTGLRNNMFSKQQQQKHEVKRTSETCPMLHCLRLYEPAFESFGLLPCSPEHLFAETCAFLSGKEDNKQRRHIPSCLGQSCTI